MSRYLKDYLSLFAIAGVIVALDAWSKQLIRDNLAYGESWNPWTWLEPYARLVHWKNTGAAFGMGQSLSWLFAGLAVLVVIAIVYYFPKVDPHSWLIRLGLAMQMGGALGNLIDRLLHDMNVTDFVSVWTFAVWNVADAAITVGTLVLLLGVWLEERKRQAPAAALSEGDDTTSSIASSGAPRNQDADEPAPRASTTAASAAFAQRDDPTSIASSEDGEAIAVETLSPAQRDPLPEEPPDA